MPKATTERFTDLGKLNLLMVVRCFRLKPIFANAPAAWKNEARFESSQNQHKNNHLASLI